METNNPYVIKNEKGFYEVGEYPTSIPYLRPEKTIFLNSGKTIDVEKLYELHKQGKVIERFGDDLEVYDKKKREEHLEKEKEHLKEVRKYKEAIEIVKELNIQYNIPKEFTKEFFDLKEKVKELEYELGVFKSEK